MKKVLLLLIILLVGCGSSASSDDKPKSYTDLHDKVIVGSSPHCIYGYWRDGASVLYFCECDNAGYTCSVAKN